MEQKEEIESTVTNVDERKEVLDETVVDNIEELSKIRYFYFSILGLASTFDTKLQFMICSVFSRINHQNCWSLSLDLLSLWTKGKHRCILQKIVMKNHGMWLNLNGKLIFCEVNRIKR